MSTPRAAEPGISPSLAVVQAAGALSLDISAGEAGAPAALPSPVAMSPWAASEACASPWSPVTPAVNPKVVSGPVRSPGVMMSPTLLTSPGGLGARTVITTKRPVQVLAGTQMSPAAAGHVPAMAPANFSPMCMSPGTQIRHNAVSLGIPLSLRAAPGEVSAPVPVRASAGAPVAPSPTAQGGRVMLPPGTQEHPPAFLRHIVTPLTGSRPRRAAGGA